MPVEWRILGADVYTCVPPPGYEKDPAVTAAIHSFDPGVIPFWRIQRWLRNGVERVIVHHGIGRYFPYPKYLRRHFHVEMPPDAEHPAPNFLDAVFEDQNTVQYYQGGPGDYQPWDWSVYYWCREKYEHITVRAYEKRVERHRQRLIAMKKAWESELEYRKKQIEPWLLKQMERLSEHDWEQLRSRQHRIAVARKLGLKTKEAAARGPKAFVQVSDPFKPRLFVPNEPRPTRGLETYGRAAPAEGR